MSLSPCHSKIFDKYNIDAADRATLELEVNDTLAAFNYTIERALTTPDGKKLLDAAVDSALVAAKKDQKGLMDTIKAQHPDLFGKAKVQDADPTKAARDLVGTINDKVVKGREMVYSAKAKRQVHLHDYHLQEQTEDVVLLAQAVQQLLERAQAIKANLSDAAIQNVNKALAAAMKLGNLIFDEVKGAAYFQVTQNGVRVDVPVTLAEVAKLRTSLERATVDLAEAVEAVPAAQAKAAMRTHNAKQATLAETRRAKEAAKEETAGLKEEARSIAGAMQDQQTSTSGELDVAQAENTAVDQAEQGSLTVTLDKSEAEIKEEEARKAEEKEKAKAKTAESEKEKPAATVLETQKERNKRKRAERVAKHDEAAGEVRTVAPESVELSEKARQKTVDAQAKAEGKPAAAPVAEKPAEAAPAVAEKPAEKARPEPALAVQAVAKKHGINLADIPGQGVGGVVTMVDLVNHMNTQKALAKEAAAKAKEEEAAAKAKAAEEAAAAPAKEEHPKAPKKKSELGPWASEQAKLYAAGFSTPVTPEEIEKPSGRNGKITKADVELAIDKRRWREDEELFKKQMQWKKEDEAEGAAAAERIFPKGPAVPKAEHKAATEEITEERTAVRGHERVVSRFGEAILGPHSADILMDRMTTAQVVTAQLDLAGTSMTADQLMDVLEEELHAKDPYRVLLRAMRKLPFGDFIVSFANRESVFSETGRYSNGVYVSGRARNTVTGEKTPLRYILLNEDLANQRHVVKVLMHELVHAATSQGLLFDNEFAQKMEMLRLEVYAELKRRGDTKSLNAYGLTNVDEFLAEALTDRDFQRILDGIQSKSKRVSVWKAMMNAIADFFGVPAAHRSVLAEVIGLVPEMLLSDAQAESVLVTRSRAEYISNQPDATAAEKAEWMVGHEAPVVGVVADENPQAKTEVETITRNFGPQVGPATTRAVDAALGQFSSKLDHSTVRNVSRRVALGMHTLDQLVRHYTKMFTNGSLGRYSDIVRRKVSMARSQQLKAEETQLEWRELERNNAADALSMANIMHDTTLEEIHPDVALSDPANAHLWKNSKINGKSLKNPRTQAAYDRLHAEYMALSPEAKKLYQKVKTFYTDQRNQLREETLRNTARVHNLDKLFTPAEIDQFAKAQTMADIQPLLATVQDAALRKDITEIAARVMQLTSVKGPYFPLRRFGQYVVEGIKEATKVYPSLKDAREAARLWRQAAPTNKATVDQTTFEVHFEDRIVEMFETEQDAAEEAAQLNDDGYLSREQGPIFVTLKEDWRAPPDSSAHVLLTQARKKFADTPSVLKALDTAFLEILLENSVKKSQLTRRKVRGATVTGMRRAFAERAYAGSWAIADVATSFDHATALRDMAKAARQGKDDAVRMGEVLREIRMRDERSLADRKVTGLDRALANFGFVWFLASPSYAAVNMTQPMLVAAPYLQAKFGFGATSELIRSYRGMFRAGMKELKDVRFGWKGAPEGLLETISKQLTPAERKMIEELTNLGIVDATFARELFNASRGETDSALSNGGERVMNIARTLPQIVEVINRVVVARAAYTLALRKGMTAEQATKAASEAVLETQFDYSDQNKPRYFKGWPGARAIMMFKMYAQGIYALLIGNVAKATRGATKAERAEGRKLLAGVITSHTLVAGVLGGVLMEPVRWAIEAVMWALGDDDEPFDLEVEVQNMLTDMFGSAAAEVIARGLPRMAGVDMSNRVGLNNLMFMDGPEARSFEEAWQQNLIGLFGPLGAVSMRGARGMDYWHKGEYSKAVENVTPKFARDLTRAWRVGTEGMTDYNGNRIAKSEKFGPLDAMYQALGFQPAEAAQTYEARSAQLDYETKLGDRRKLLMQQWRRADDRDEFFREEIRAFNRANPEFRVRPADLFRSLREQRKRERDTKMGAFTEKKAVRQQARFAED